MDGTSKLASVKQTTPAMATALPGLPMQQGVIVRLVRILGASMTAYFEPVFRRVGLSENSFHVLCLLSADEKNQASPSELSDMVGTSRGNMTRILEELLQARLVTRTVELRDTRRHAIHLTDRGREMAASVVPRISAPLVRAFSELTPEALRELDQTLQSVIRALDQRS